MSLEDKIDALSTLISHNHRETLDHFIALDSRLAQIESWVESAARLLAPLALPVDDQGRQVKLDDVLRGLTGLCKTSYDEALGQNVFLRALCDELGVDYDALRKTTEPASAPSADFG